MAVVFGNGNKIGEILALMLTIISTVFAGLQKTLDFKKQASGKRKIGGMYLRISKKINLMLCMMADDILVDKEEIIKRAEAIEQDIAEANELGTQFPTNDQDFQKARQGIRGGEETYTDEDLSLWQ